MRCLVLIVWTPIKTHILDSKFESVFSLLINSCRRITFTVALKHTHRACAALLNPGAAEPLRPDAKALLEMALMEANMEREKAILKETVS